MRCQRTLRELQLSGADRRLEGLARHRLEQTLALELELLALELALRRKYLALRVDAGVGDCAWNRTRLLPQRMVALDLLYVELLLLHALLEVELVELARVGRAQVVAPRPGALLQLEVQRVVLLLHVEAARIGGGRRQGR